MSQVDKVGLSLESKCVVFQIYGDECHCVRSRWAYWVYRPPDSRLDGIQDLRQSLDMLSKFQDVRGCMIWYSIPRCGEVGMESVESIFAEVSEA